MAGEIKYDIIEEIGLLSENAKGWRKELNLISWNGATPKYDIRDFIYLWIVFGQKLLLEIWS